MDLSDGCSVCLAFSICDYIVHLKDVFSYIRRNVEVGFDYMPDLCYAVVCMRVSCSVTVGVGVTFVSVMVRMNFSLVFSV